MSTVTNEVVTGGNGGGNTLILLICYHFIDYLLRGLLGGRKRWYQAEVGKRVLGGNGGNRVHQYAPILNRWYVDKPTAEQPT